jgi:flagellar basal-body rod modification protein FlgD
MTIPTANNYVNTISTNYESYDSKAKEKDDALGRDAFLTMMVAQLQNQDPLNPMEASEFSSQLAQFSQLEQLLNLNETMTSMKAAFEDNSSRDVTSYIGKEIIGDVDSMSVKDGSASSGYYSLPKPGEVRVEVYDSIGRVVKTIFLGQKEAGSHSIQWDGTDSSGNLVPDGTYKYAVGADMGYGFEEVATTVTGTVDGIVFSGEKPFLVVDGVWVNPDSLLQVKQVSGENSSSIIDYLGKNVTSSAPLIHVDNNEVTGGRLSFELENSDSVIVGIYDSSHNLIRTIGIAASGTTSGINLVEWDGLDNDGQAVGNGIYSYEVTTSTGSANIAITDNVTGIKTVDGSQLLVFDSSGRLTSVSSITAVN